VKILINALSARRGGIVTYTRNVASALAARGIEVVIAAPSNLNLDGGQAEHVKIDVADYRPMRRAIWEQVVWRRIVSRIRPDLLFSSANYALLRCPIPQVLLIREGGLFDPFYLANIAPEQGLKAAVLRNLRRRLMIRSGRQSDRVITPSETTRSQLLMWAPDLSPKVSANHYGAPIETFVPQAGAIGQRRKGPTRLLYISVYYPHKAPHVLVRSVDRLNAEGFPVNATISMTEAEIEGRAGGALDRLIIRSAASRDAIQFGCHDYNSLPDLYRNHDIFVFPSVNETFGHPMAEAMSAGIPIIAADTPINREICAGAALYFKPFSHQDLAKQIRTLAVDADLRARMIVAARARVTSEFRWEAHGDRLIATFEAAIADHARS
jgi:glycosyltransferase involved in cell wall biosynthesis